MVGIVVGVIVLYFYLGKVVINNRNVDNKKFITNEYMKKSAIIGVEKYDENFVLELGRNSPTLSSLVVNYSNIIDFDLEYKNRLSRHSKLCKGYPVHPLEHSWLIVR